MSPPSRAATVARRQPALCRPAGLLVLLLAGALGCQESGPGEKSAARAQKPVALEAVQAQVQRWPRRLRVQGLIAGDEHAVVGTRIAGQVEQVRVDLGSVVKEGEELARLRTQDLELLVQQAEAQLRQTRASIGLKPDDSEEHINKDAAPIVRQELATLEDARAKLARSVPLYRRSAISIEELQLLEAAVKVAEARYQSALNSVEERLALLRQHKAELALARQHLEDAVLRAPFDGTVEQRHVAPGVYLQTGDPVVTLVRTNPIRFRAGVPERAAFQVHLGQPVHVQVEGETRGLSGKIDRISPALDLASRSLTVEVSLANPEGRLRAGLFAEGEIVVADDAQALAVPRAAVAEFAGVEKVWVIKDGQAREVRIRTGRRESTLVEIVEGLSAGDLVAADARTARSGPVAVVSTPPRSQGAE